jgi:UDP-N-acetylglucosamine 2-epimerase
MPFPFDPQPSTLWTLHRDGKVASCDLRFVPTGTEVRILRNGGLLYSRIFATGEDALTWAEEERNRMIAGAWATNAD